MTWHAPAGQIILRGKEADIFRDAILEMCDDILEITDEDFVFGWVRLFEAMSRTQQVASLEKVGHHLFHSTDTCLELHAWSEATLASILKQIGNDLSFEIEYGEGKEIRQFVAEYFEEEFELTDWDDYQEWIFYLDCYEDRFLWDADYDDDAVADMPPDQARQFKAMFGVLEDYYSATPPDLESEDEIPDAIKRITSDIRER